MKSRPSLGGVVEVALEAIFSVECVTKLQQSSTQVKVVLEGLLSHFFSADRSGYAVEDVLWFFELVNKQEQWFSKDYKSKLVKYKQEEEIEVSATLQVQREVNDCTCSTLY